MLAATLQGLVPLLVEILIVGLIAWLLWWLIGFINPPQPFAKVLQVIVAVAAVLYLVKVLLGFV